MRDLTPFGEVWTVKTKISGHSPAVNLTFWPQRRGATGTVHVAFISRGQCLVDDDLLSLAAKGWIIKHT